ncbi:MAG: sigma-70 family RNA polymerase sigma factor [Lachnospiraceae bacterium]|nr:sigma-70 family RNA polymerase sigma factor [Lachnospiraceae bacterium]
MEQWKEREKEQDVLQTLCDDPAKGIRAMTEQYGGLVYAVTWRRLQGKFSKEDIEECVSDIFYELYRCREKIDLEKGSIKTFLLTIAERQAIRYYERKVEHLDKVSLQEQYERGEELPDTIDVEQQTIQKEESERLLEAIKGLGEPTSHIIIQKYYYGLTAKEIGEELGLTKNAVEKRIKRGLAKLKQALGMERAV